MNKIVRVGQVSNKGSQAGMVYDPNRLFPTICAGLMVMLWEISLNILIGGILKA